MPARTSVSDSDMDDAIRRYLEGEFRLSEAAKLVRVDVSRLRAEMAARGVRPRTKSEGQALRHVRDAGSDWKRRFTEGGARTRAEWVGSPAHRKRMAEIGAQYGPLNKGRKPSGPQLNARSRAHERALLKISPLALEFHDMLIRAGRAGVIEKAAGRYNIDIAVGPVAVEVHRYSFNPLGATRIRERQRTHYLCNRGWLICYVWARPADDFRLTTSAADYVVSLAQAAETAPAMIGEYRVIRSTGELIASGRGDGDELTGVRTG